MSFQIYCMRCSARKGSERPKFSRDDVGRFERYEWRSGCFLAEIENVAFESWLVSITLSHSETGIQEFVAEFLAELAKCDGDVELVEDDGPDEECVFRAASADAGRRILVSLSRKRDEWRTAFGDDVANVTAAQAAQMFLAKQ